MSVCAHGVHGGVQVFAAQQQTAADSIDRRSPPPVQADSTDESAALNLTVSASDRCVGIKDEPPADML